jgi:hypothetical protein
LGILSEPKEAGGCRYGSAVVWWQGWLQIMPSRATVQQNMSSHWTPTGEAQDNPALCSPWESSKDPFFSSVLHASPADS